MPGEQQRVWELMDSIGACMLVTKRGAGMHARPMAPIVDADARTLHFLTDEDSAKESEIERDPTVVAAFANGSARNVVVYGKATIVRDRALIAKLWNPGAQAFWPKGPDDPHVCAIAVEPSEAEFWDGSKIVAAAKYVVARATGSRLDPGESGKTTL